MGILHSLYRGKEGRNSFGLEPFVDFGVLNGGFDDCECEYQFQPRMFEMDVSRLLFWRNTTSIIGYKGKGIQKRQ